MKFLDIVFNPKFNIVFLTINEDRGEIAVSDLSKDHPLAYMRDSISGVLYLYPLDRTQIDALRSAVKQPKNDKDGDR
jgi:hypothetical protein